MDHERARSWTIRSLMQSAIDYLTTKGFQEARLNVELLLAHALNVQRIQIYTNFDKPLTAEEVSGFRSLFERRLNHEPVQYIIGTAYFMGLQFKVDRRVLIPRPETETLVEQTIIACKSFLKDDCIEILEVGTGSGNLAVSVAKYVKNAKLTSIDCSEDSLTLALENARLNNVDSQIDFIHGDVFHIKESDLKKKAAMIISNPPYIEKSEWETLAPEVRDYEPRNALTDNADGMTVYKKILELTPSLLAKNGTVLFEVGYGKDSAVKTLMENSGFGHVVIVNDLQNIPRIVCGSRALVDGLPLRHSVN